jgi:protein-tyrosine phosphatase
MNKMRNQTWHDCLNVRDLGGLRTIDGKQTKYGRLVRADNLDCLTQEGIAAMVDFGISTIIDMRVEPERNADLSYAGINRQHVPLEDQTDKKFWRQWSPYNCTPLYYNPFLEHCSMHVARVFEAIAEMSVGGVIFHCASGRDRTGLKSFRC